jgi:hypothetical protein
VGVSVRVRPFVAVIDAVGAVGAGFVRSTVGVMVGVSRVGIGAWVGVEINVPFGKLINVGGAFVDVETKVGRTTKVGVAGRSTNEGRSNRLNIPAQYSTDVPTRIITRQP